jgi:hypothetical protein
MLAYTFYLPGERGIIMKKAQPETMNSLQTCITFLRSIGDSLQDYTDELNTARRSAWEMSLDFESFGSSFHEYAKELQELQSPFEECKTQLQNAGFPLREAADESEVFDSDVPVVSYEIIKKRAKELSK